MVDKVDFGIKVSVAAVVGSLCVEVSEILAITPAVTEESKSDVSTMNDLPGDVKLTGFGTVIGLTVIKDPADVQTDKLVFVTGTTALVVVPFTTLSVVVTSTTALVVVPDSSTSVTQFASILKQNTAVVG